VAIRVFQPASGSEPAAGWPSPCPTPDTAARSNNKPRELEAKMVLI
jgi:hypothetical protein